MRQLYITSFIIISSLVVWLSAVGISQYLSNEPARRLHPVSDMSQPGEGKKVHSDRSHSLPELEKEYEKAPNSLTAAVDFANALFEDGMIHGNAENLKRAVGVFHEVLELDAAQPDALLGLGTLSLHVGVPDKAIDYYRKYLEVKPEDLVISSNLALAEAKNGEVDTALERLDTVLGEKPDFVIALVTKGLVLAETGDTEAARALWLKAESLEKSDVLKQRISSLIVDSLRKADVQTSGELKSDLVSSESILKNYFAQHEILGPKIHDMFGQSSTRFAVYVRDFPVSSMPAVAREVFESKLEEQLRKTDFSELVIIDAESREELLMVSQGD